MTPRGRDARSTSTSGLTYRGAAVVSPRGERVAGGRALLVRLLPLLRAGRLAGALLHASTKRSRPDRRPGRLRARARGRAARRRERRDRLDFMSGGVDRRRRCRATASPSSPRRRSNLPAGAVHLSARSPTTGIRVWMDDERIIDRWTPHESAIDIGRRHRRQAPLQGRILRARRVRRAAVRDIEAMMTWLSDPEILDRPRDADLPRNRPRRRQHHLHLHPLGQAARRPSSRRRRRIGLLLAMGTRILLLFSLAWIVRLTAPLFAVWGHEISGRDLILIVGGLFLLAKSTHEIHDRLEGDEGRRSARRGLVVRVGARPDRAARHRVLARLGHHRRRHGRRTVR